MLALAAWVEGDEVIARGIDQAPIDRCVRLLRRGRVDPALRAEHRLTLAIRVWRQEVVCADRAPVELLRAVRRVLPNEAQRALEPKATVDGCRGDPVIADIAARVPDESLLVGLQVAEAA